ncbi:hypothetical protein ACHAXT_012773 [Thalassiosira profunda]
MGRLPLLIAALLASLASATVTVSSTGHQYHSRPAAFGFELEYGLQYVALLQFVESDVHLCAGTEEDLDGEFNDGRRVGEFGEDDDWGYEGAIYGGDRGIGMGENGGKRGLRSAHGEGHRASLLQTVGYQTLMGAGDVVNIGSLGDDNDKKEWKDIMKNETQKEIPVVPSNGVPVAILAKRGQCTYETKARVASTLTTPHGTVRFVIVYDNLPSDGNHLITMMPEERSDERGIPRHKGHDLWKGVGLVFVSYESGVDLREFLTAQSHAVTAAGGPRILIDGRDRWIFPPMDESAAGLAFLLMLFGCVCSLSLFLNTTFYGSRSVEGSAVDERHLFLLGPDGFANPANNQGTGRRGNGLRLLTREEVETLPTREYCGDSSDGDLSPRSSSSGLELRDKSEMPYLAGEEPTEGLDEVAATGGTLARDDDNEGSDEAAPGGGGGLCESLLPSKKAADDEEYYFRHNSCSICLDEYQVGEQIRVLPCQHTFHSDCIFPWLTERSPTCPLCKAMFEAVREEADEEEGGVEGQEDEEEEENTEASAPAPPPLDEEPPVHRRRRQRQRRGRRRSRQESNVDAAAEAEDANADPAPEGPSGQINEEEGGTVGSSPEVEERQASGLRGRLWGLFGGGTARATTTPTSALEEPLLTSSDDDGNEEEVV